MATKQPTQLCYQINGGTCRNKVSAKNYYVCAAGHRAVKGMSRDEIATQLPAEAIRKMGWNAQCDLARNPSIDREMTQALFNTGNGWVRRDLARNPSIDREMAQALFATRDKDTWSGLARNPSIDREMTQALFATRDEDIWSGLATNPSIDREMAQALFDTGNNWIRYNLATNPSIDRDMIQALFATRDKDIWSGLAKNPSIDHDMAQALFDTGDDWPRRNLARNPSIDREMAITLAKDGHAPIGYLKNKSITELCARQNISLINEHPKEFGEAYLDHLLGSGEDLDQMKALLCYSYDSYRKASGGNPKGYRELILDKYPNDEEVKILLS